MVKKAAAGLEVGVVVVRGYEGPRIERQPPDPAARAPAATLTPLALGLRKAHLTGVEP